MDIFCRIEWNLSRYENYLRTWSANFVNSVLLEIWIRHRPNWHPHNSCLIINKESIQYLRYRKSIDFYSCFNFSLQPPAPVLVDLINMWLLGSNGFARLLGTWFCLFRVTGACDARKKICLQLHSCQLYGENERAQFRKLLSKHSQS